MDSVWMAWAWVIAELIMITVNIVKSLVPALKADNESNEEI